MIILIQGIKYYFKRVPLLGSWIPSLVPTGRYKFEIETWKTVDTNRMFTMELYFDVTNSLLIVW